MSKKRQGRKKLGKGMKMLGGYHRNPKAGSKVRTKKIGELNRKQLER